LDRPGSGRLDRGEHHAVGQPAAGGFVPREGEVVGDDLASPAEEDDLDPGDVPRTECLADVVRRAVPYWESAIVPDLRAAAAKGGGVLVAAHGNSIRALRKHLEDIADDAITGLEIPTGIPYRMLLDDDLRVDSADYLGDPEAAAAAAAAVAQQGDLLA